MAAFESPWLRSMPETASPAPGSTHYSHEETTVAGFSSTANSSQRSTILLHQKTPLLLATPPQVTRALASSHAYIVPLNKLAALLTWTTGDPWQSFLFVAAFVFTVLYGDLALIYAGPVVLAISIVVGVYYRRYSPLSSSGWAGNKKKQKTTLEADASSDRKSLDEILGTLQAFNGRCNILWKPVLALGDFLSTQQTATSATTQPSLIKLLIRVSLVTPIWFALSLPPLRIVTAQRVVLVTGTLILTWHSRSARITRSILWRSRTVRNITSVITGLNFDIPASKSHKPVFPSSNYTILKQAKPKDNKIRFTFAVYENQRRWLGLGWTSNMVAYERGPWTDDHLNNVSPPDKFELPEVEGGHARWQWAEGSSWHVETPPPPAKGGSDVKSGEKKEREDEATSWVYYDNKWLNGSRGVDGWSKYTRRRKWVRDAELVDLGTGPTSASTSSVKALPNGTATPTAAARHQKTPSDAGSETSRTSRSWFSRSPTKQQHSRSSSTVVGSGDGAGTGTNTPRSLGRRSESGSGIARWEEGRDTPTPTERLKEREADWGLGDDASMELG